MKLIIDMDEALNSTGVFSDRIAASGVPRAGDADSRPRSGRRLTDHRTGGDDRCRERGRYPYPSRLAVPTLSTLVERPLLRQSNLWVNLDRRQESTVPLLDSRIQLPHEVAESGMAHEAGRDDFVGQA